MSVSHWMNIFISISFSNNILEISEQEMSFILNFKVSSPHWTSTARISTFNLDFSFDQKHLPTEKRLSTAALVSRQHNINSVRTTKFPFIKCVHFWNS